MTDQVPVYDDSSGTGTGGQDLGWDIVAFPSFLVWFGCKDNL